MRRLSNSSSDPSRAPMRRTSHPSFVGCPPISSPLHPHPLTALSHLLPSTSINGVPSPSKPSTQVTSKRTFASPSSAVCGGIPHRPQPLPPHSIVCSFVSQSSSDTNQSPSIRLNQNSKSPHIPSKGNSIGENRRAIQIASLPKSSNLSHRRCPQKALRENPRHSRPLLPSVEERECQFKTP
jgi:hypothetical protein